MGEEGCPFNDYIKKTHSKHKRLSHEIVTRETNEYIIKGSVYFAAKMPTAMAWLELLCCQSEAWQKRSEKQKINPKAKPNPNP